MCNKSLFSLTALSPSRTLIGFTSDFHPLAVWFCVLGPSLWDVVDRWTLLFVLSSLSNPLSTGSREQLCLEKTCLCCLCRNQMWVCTLNSATLLLNICKIRYFWSTNGAALKFKGCLTTPEHLRMQCTEIQVHTHSVCDYVPACALPS